MVLKHSPGWAWLWVLLVDTPACCEIEQKAKGVGAWVCSASSLNSRTFPDQKKHLPRSPMCERMCITIAWQNRKCFSLLWGSNLLETESYTCDVCPMGTESRGTSGKEWHFQSDRKQNNWHLQKFGLPEESLTWTVHSSNPSSSFPRLL